MRHQLLIADPGGERPVAAAHRHAVEARIGDRHRLDVDRLARCRSASAIEAAPNSVLLNGRTHIAVAGRALGKQHHGVAAGQARGDLARPARRTCACRSRSTKTVRCSLASQPTTGQPAMSDLAMKVTSATEPRTTMSVQETWLEAISSGRSRPVRP